MAWTPASSSARRFHSPESSPNHSNIHSWVPSVLVTKPSRDMTILRITFLSLMVVETYPTARTHRSSVDSGAGDRRDRERATTPSASVDYRLERRGAVRDASRPLAHC